MVNDKIKKITGVAILLAIEVILQVLGNYVALPGGISVNLSLIPIAIAAIVYGPLAGAFLGLINGILVLFSPSTISFFFQYAPVGTVLTCLLKCTIAGFLSGLAFKIFKNKNQMVGSVIAALLVPIINTGLFALGAFTVMINAIEVNNEANVNAFKYVFLVLIGWNFIFELLVTSVLTPSIEKIRKIMTRRNKHAL